MKKIIVSLLAATVLAGFSSCSDDDKTVPSVMIDQNTVTSVAKPGEVVFHWTKPTNPDYYYIKVKFNDPARGGSATKLSVLSELPGTKGASYESPHMVSVTPFRYLWLRIDSSTSGSDWVALSELSVTEVLTTISDPENEN